MIFGWDVSTSIIGVSVFTPEGRFVEAKYLDLRKVEGGLMEKAELADTFVSQIIGPYSVKPDQRHDHYIEDRLGSFASGRTMLQTLMTLASFNTLVSWFIWNSIDRDRMEHIHPTTVKSLMRAEGLVIPKGADKKVLTLNFVVAKEPGFPLELNRNQKPQPYCYDMADAYIIGRAGMKKFGRKLNGTKQKA